MERLGVGDPQWIGTDNLPPLLAARWEAPEVGPDSLAVLQYTSGSTGIPKGVMLNQRHLMLNSSMIRRAMGIDEHSVGVAWLPPYHDMGLIGGILQPVFSGFPIHLLSPYSFLQRPLRWLDAMTRYRGTISSAPNFAYSLCANRIKPEQLERLDLSNWRLAANGAEPIRADTLAHFARVFKPCGFDARSIFPCYGLAEATLYVSGSPFQTGRAPAPDRCPGAGRRPLRPERRRGGQCPRAGQQRHRFARVRHQDRRSGRRNAPRAGPYRRNLDRRRIGRGRLLGSSGRNRSDVRGDPARHRGDIHADRRPRLPA